MRPHNSGAQRVIISDSCTNLILRSQIRAQEGRHAGAIIRNRKLQIPLLEKDRHGRVYWTECGRLLPLYVCFFAFDVVRILTLEQHETRIHFREYIDFQSIPGQIGDTIQSAGNDHGLNDIMQSLLEQFHASTVWRFWPERTRPKSDQSIVYCYRCCQDEDHHSTNLNSQGISDVRVMERFHCQSQSVFSWSLSSRILAVTHTHEKHPPYAKSSLTPEVLAFIHDKLMLPPAKIYQVLRAQDSASLPGKELASRYQVYRVWQNANASRWSRCENAYQSACLLLHELSTADQCVFRFTPAFFEYANVGCVAIYIDCLIDKIGPNHIHELAMDATYGTNNEAMDLFSVIAEFDGTGVPIAYGFVEVVGRREQRQQASRQPHPSQTQPSETQRPILAVQGSMIGILSQFLMPVVERNINPFVFHCDKDNAEISAIGEVRYLYLVRLRSHLLTHDSLSQCFPSA